MNIWRAPRAWPPWFGGMGSAGGPAWEAGGAAGAGNAGLSRPRVFDPVTHVRPSIEVFAASRRALFGMKCLQGQPASLSLCNRDLRGYEPS